LSNRVFAESLLSILDEYLKMNPITLSHSSISLFLECPRCFWLDKVKGKKRPATIFPGLPDGMDRILKEHFDRHRSEGTLPEELHGEFHGRLFDDIERLNEWRNWRKGLRYTDEKTGFSLMGAIDDLFVTNMNHFAPLDFKTRGVPKKDDTHSYYQHQMNIYSFLLQHNGMTPASYAILIFYSPVRVNERHDVEFKPEPMKIDVNPANGERIFKDAVKCLLSEEPKAGECEWCHWSPEG